MADDENEKKRKRAYIEDMLKNDDVVNSVADHLDKKYPVKLNTPDPAPKVILNTPTEYHANKVLPKGEFDLSDDFEKKKKKKKAQAYSAAFDD